MLYLVKSFDVGRRGAQVTIDIGVIIAIGGLLLTFLGYQLSKKSDAKTDTRESAELKVELGYIRKGVDDIRIDLRSNERQMSDFGERITRVEESSKQAHRRLDNIEQKKGGDNS